MSSKLLTATDYRNEIPGIDTYGRHICSECGRRRRVNAWWSDTGKILCRECSLTPDKALMYSVRGH